MLMNYINGNANKYLRIFENQQKKKTKSNFRIKEQPRFPKFSKNHAYLFLYACFWDKTNAKKAMQKYCHLHAISPELFNNRDPMLPAIQNILNIA